MIAFELHKNGKRVVTAGVPGLAVLSIVLVWRNRRPQRGRRKPHLSLNISGLESNGPKRELDTYPDWEVPAAKIGDTIRIRIIKADKVDEPATRWRPEGNFKPATVRMQIEFPLQLLRHQRREIDRHVAQLERELERLPAPRSFPSSKGAFKVLAFEIHRNGRRVVKAGVPGFGELTAILTWCNRRVRPRKSLGLSVSGSDSNGTDSTGAEWERATNVKWDVPRVKVGDTIHIRVIKSNKVDEPANEYRPKGQEPTVEQTLKHRLTLCRNERRRVDRKIAHFERRLKRLRTRRALTQQR